MSSAVARKFLDAASETLEVVDLRGRELVSPVFVVMSFVIIVLTSFTTNPQVVTLTLATSVIMLVTTHNLRNHLRKLSSALVYVFLFSLIALTPFLIEGSVYLYVLYVARAAGATSFLIIATTVSGWERLSEFMKRFKLPGVALVLMIHIKIISVLLRDTSKALLSREARLVKSPSIRSLPAYAAVIGDLVIRSNERGERALLAVKARTFSKATDRLSARTSFKLTKLDILVSLVAFTESLMYLRVGCLGD